MEQDTAALSFTKPEGIEDPLTALLRTRDRILIKVAVQAELAEFLNGFSQLSTSEDKPRAICNGYHLDREILTSIGPASVRIPKARSRTGPSVFLRSSQVPPYVRKIRIMGTAFPWLYLKEIFTGEMSEALSVLVGPDAKSISPEVILRLKKKWKGQYLQRKKKRFDKDRLVYLWADDIYNGLRDIGERLCALVSSMLTTMERSTFWPSRTG